MKRSIQRVLLDHYDRERRELPWRGETDPYRILVSEVMLQQTRVRTVLGYYDRWLARFPEIDSLADADIDEVLKAWEGLGYYRRARNLHRAACVVRERPAGAFPDTYSRLRDLPGVGEYTAGAVASIAFGEAVPAVDGNVRRVLSRLFDEANPKATWLRARAGELVDAQRPGDWNQALMELGATLCSPRAPRCGCCPVADFCAACRAGTQDERPGVRKSAAVKQVQIVLALFEVGDRVLLERRPPDGLLAGMWSFPEAPPREIGADARATVDPRLPDAAARESVLEIATRRGLVPVGPPAPLPEVSHSFTHLHAVYQPWVVTVVEPVDAEGGVWIDPDAPNELAVPIAQQKVLASLSNRAADGLQGHGRSRGPIGHVAGGLSCPSR